MHLRSINLTQAIRNAISALICLIFLISGWSVTRVESSGVSVGSRVSAAEAALGPGESGCTDADFTHPATSPEGAGDQLSRSSRRLQ
jgi:hypothetical protein